MSKTRKRDFNSYDDENDKLDFKKKKHKMRFGKDGMSQHRREKMSPNQLLKAYETGRLSEDE